MKLYKCCTPFYSMNDIKTIQQYNKKLEIWKDISALLYVILWYNKSCTSILTSINVDHTLQHTTCCTHWCVSTHFDVCMSYCRTTIQHFCCVLVVLLYSICRITMWYNNILRCMLVVQHVVWNDFLFHSIQQRIQNSAISLARHRHKKQFND